jgi:LytS/YehU family sensor histidine kinase
MVQLRPEFPIDRFTTHSNVCRPPLTGGMTAPYPSGDVMPRPPSVTRTWGDTSPPADGWQALTMVSALVAAMAIGTSALPFFDARELPGVSWPRQLGRSVAAASIAVGTLLLAYHTLSRRGDRTQRPGQWLVELAAIALLSLVVRAILDHAIPATGSSPDKALPLALLLCLRLADVAMLIIVAQGIVHWRRARHARRRRAQLLATEHAQRIDARAAELRMRKAELLPHFLCNALSAVAHLLPTSPETASTLLRAIERILDDAQSRMAIDFTTVSDELHRLRPFMEIERARLGERLSVDCVVDPQFADAPIPDWIIQPLVENAVRHGLSPHGGGRLRIAVREAECASHFRIDVIDEAVRTDRSPALRPAPISNCSIGLANIRARLAALYGDDASVTLTASPTGNGMVASLLLPRHPHSEATTSDALRTPRVVVARSGHEPLVRGRVVAASLVLVALVWIGHRGTVAGVATALVVLAALDAVRRHGRATTRVRTTMLRISAIGVAVSIGAAMSLVVVDLRLDDPPRLMGALIAFSTLYAASVAVTLVLISRRRVDRLFSRLRRAGGRVLGQAQRGEAHARELSAHHASVATLQPALTALAERVASDPSGATALIDQLATVLRVELRRAPDEVALQDEVASTAAFVAFAREVHGAALVVEWEVDPDVASARVPSRILRPVLQLLLDPHADVGRDGAWSVRGRCRAVDGRLMLSVHLPTRLVAGRGGASISALVNALRARVASVVGDTEPTVRVLSGTSGCDVVALELPLVLDVEVSLEDAAGG